MGTSKRYAHVIDARMDARVLEQIAAEGMLQTLTMQELQLDRVPLTVDPRPHRRVRAWVRFGDSPVQVNAIALRWTRDAIGIGFKIGDTQHRCWVWGSAIEAIDE